MNAQNPEQVAVAGVLAGGRSKRMGRPKALIELPGGQTIIEHVVQIALQVTDHVVILGQTQELPCSLAGLAVWPDDTPSAGPLSGLRSLLEHTDNDWALLLACDMPRLDVSLLRRLIEHISIEADAVVFRRTDRPGSYHACCGLYHPRLFPLVSDLLQQRQSSLQYFLSRVVKIDLMPTCDEDKQLHNVNTPEDLDGLGKA